MAEVELKNKNRNTKVNEKQKKFMIEYLKKEPDLISGKFCSSFTFKDAKAKWSELAELLNSIPGASKGWKEWRKTWQDLRCKTKQKATNNKRNMNKTGGGPLCDDTLTTIEEDIVDIIKPVTIDGHPNVQESYVNINILSELDINNDVHEITSNDSHNNAVNVNQNLPTQQVNNNEEENDKGTPLNPNKNHKKIPTKKKLQYTAAAETAYAKMLENKLQIKQNYYNRKLELLTDMVQSQKNATSALEQCAIALNRTAIALEELI